MKERLLYRVTDALSMFVERHCNAVHICLMAVYKKLSLNSFYVQFIVKTAI